MLEVADGENCGHCRMLMLEVADGENCVDRGNRAYCRMLMLDVADRGNCVYFVQLTLVSVCIAGYRCSRSPTGRIVCTLFG